MTNCPSCGAVVTRAGAHFCPACGGALAPPTLNFGRHLTTLAHDYVPRPWIEAALAEWLAAPDAPFLVLTGLPGSGKSAIAARLARLSARSPSPPPEGPFPVDFLDAIHFCLPREPRWLSPTRFVESVATQLAARHPGLAANLLSPRLGDAPVNIEVQQQVGPVTGSVTALSIQQLQLGALPAADLWDRLVVRPLEVPPTPASGPLLLLVDGLDAALGSVGAGTIPDLIAGLRALPPGLRLLVTMRPEAGLLERLSHLNPTHLALSSGAALAMSHQDVGRYVAARLAGDERLPAGVVDSLAERSGGNFLYARSAIRLLVQQGGEGAVDPSPLTPLPDALDDLFRLTLDRLVVQQAGQAGRDRYWADSLAPVLGVLAVARVPLQRDAIAAVTKLSRAAVGRLLRSLGSLLVQEEIDGERPAYALFHPSFAEFLLDESLAGAYWLDAREENDRIATHYLAPTGGKPDWGRLDEYGLLYLGEHLLDAGRESELDRLLTDAFVTASLEFFGWNLPFVEMLQRIAPRIAPPRLTILCLRLVRGRRPNSLVARALLRMLRPLRRQLAAEGQPFGRPQAPLDGSVGEILDALEVGGPTAVKRLDQLLKEVQNERVRGLIALALGETGRAEATPLLTSLVWEARGSEGWSAADALISLGDQAVVADLIEGVESGRGEPAVRRRALYILGHLGATEARRLVLPALRDRYIRVRGEGINLLWLLHPVPDGAQVALAKLGLTAPPADAGEDRAWRPERNEWLQQRLVTALGRIAPASAAEPLRRFQQEVAARPMPISPADRRQRARLQRNIRRALSDLERRHRFGLPPHPPGPAYMSADSAPGTRTRSSSDVDSASK